MLVDHFGDKTCYVCADRGLEDLRGSAKPGFQHQLTHSTRSPNKEGLARAVVRKTTMGTPL